MGEDTCARAKVLAKREARNLHAFSWRPAPACSFAALFLSVAPLLARLIR